MTCPEKESANGNIVTLESATTLGLNLKFGNETKLSFSKFGVELVEKMTN